MGNKTDQNAHRCIDRRHFLALIAASLGPASVSNGVPAKPQLVDAGQASLYASDGLYDKFHDQGFFLVRKAGKLVALSSYCTHRKCKLAAESDRTFTCKCHGSTFSPEGKVTEGPAKRDLPIFPISTGSNGHLIVNVSAIY